jgi:hypothetical protein
MGEVSKELVIRHYEVRVNGEMVAMTKNEKIGRICAAAIKDAFVDGVDIELTCVAELKGKNNENE